MNLNYVAFDNVEHQIIANHNYDMSMEGLLDFYIWARYAQKEIPHCF